MWMLEAIMYEDAVQRQQRERCNLFKSLIVMCLNSSHRYPKQRLLDVIQRVFLSFCPLYSPNIAVHVQHGQIG